MAYFYIFWRLFFMIYDFYCDRCSRNCDFSCLECSYYNHILICRLSKFEELLLDLKDVYDNVHDSNDVLCKVRHNQAIAFDTAVTLFDDIFCDPIMSDVTLNEYYDLPDQFSLHFF